MYAISTVTGVKHVTTKACAAQVGQAILVCPIYSCVFSNPSRLVRSWARSLRQTFQVKTKMATGISIFTSTRTPWTKIVSVSERSHCRTPKQSVIMNGLDHHMPTDVPCCYAIIFTSVL